MVSAHTVFLEVISESQWGKERGRWRAGCARSEFVAVVKVVNPVKQIMCQLRVQTVVFVVMTDNQLWCLVMITVFESVLQIAWKCVFYKWESFNASGSKINNSKWHHRPWKSLRIKTKQNNIVCAKGVKETFFHKYSRHCHLACSEASSWENGSTFCM